MKFTFQEPAKSLIVRKIVVTGSGPENQVVQLQNSVVDDEGSSKTPLDDLADEIEKDVEDTTPDEESSSNCDYPGCTLHDTGTRECLLCKQPHHHMCAIDVGQEELSTKCYKCWKQAVPV